MGRRGGKLDAVALVSAAHRDCHARVGEVAAIGGILAKELRPAVAVRDDLRALTDRGVLGRAQIVHRGRSSFHEQDVAVGTDCRDHLDVEGDLASPARVSDGVAVPAVLVSLLETAIGRGAWAQPELGAVRRQVRFGRGQVESVDDRHRDA